ncbi:MAG: ParA family protein [Pseudomarimonas sp.]
MLAILVASSKGGCGKTTVATHLAAYFALAGKHTVLVDADPQRSSTRWCERRAALDHAALPINGCRRGWQKLIPADTQRMIVDAPAGAMATDLEGFIAEVDAIVVPVLPSVIDMDASIEFLASLSGSERVRRHKVAVGLVGNRTKPWTSASANALAQIETWPYPLVTSLRDSQAYGLLSGLGKSLFDYRSENVRRHQQDWDALMKWLRQVNKGTLQSSR